MKHRTLPFLTMVLLCLQAPLLWAADNQPHIGYLYPAGGQQGREVLVTVGGQFLQKPTDVCISGQGVKAEIVKYYRPIFNLQKEQRDWIVNQLKDARDKLQNSEPAPDAAAAEKKTETLPDKIRVPEHPLLYDLEAQDLRQLAHIQNMLLRPRTRIQPNRQIAELILLKLTIDKDAGPGPRELRIRTASGLTNPMIVEVGQFAEYAEMEPNDKDAYPEKLPGGTDLPKAKPLALPVILNGQILPGDIDRFQFRAEAGQQIVIDAHARALVPYLADAVPGWFQAVVSLVDSAGNEVAFADDFRFNPDPVLLCKIPRTGEYELIIRDSIYRGREDFVYRVSVGQVPFITHVFPLGAKAGTSVTATLEGWNLPRQQVTLDTAPGNDFVRSVCVGEAIVSNPVRYAVDTLPEVLESAPNDSLKDAQSIQLPVIVNGRIESAGDADVYGFAGTKGQAVSLEVIARKLNSPLDSLLRLTDASGATVAWNDDYTVRTADYLFKDAEGLHTHQADSYLTAQLPADGRYFVHVSDAQGHGTSAHAYRLKISIAAPDFVLWTVPSSLTAPAGASVPLTVYVLRKNGFDGPIQLTLADPDSGCRLQGGTIPAGKESIRMTVKVPAELAGKIVALKLQGKAEHEGQAVVRPVVPSEDTMQAFLYRHLVPAQELSVAVLNTKASPIELSTKSPVKIAAGGETEVVFKCARWLAQNIRLELQNPPDGITLDGLKEVPAGLSCTLKADSAITAELTDNLIIEAFRENPVKDKDGKPTGKTQLRPVGFAEAVPVRVVPVGLK